MPLRPRAELCWIRTGSVSLWLQSWSVLLPFCQGSYFPEQETWVNCVSTLFHSSLEQRCVGTTALGNSIGYFEFSAMDGTSCLVYSHANCQAYSQASLSSEQPIMIICSSLSTVALLSGPPLPYLVVLGIKLRSRSMLSKQFCTELPCSPAPMVLILFNIYLCPFFFFSEILKRG